MASNEIGSGLDDYCIGDDSVFGELSSDPSDDSDAVITSSILPTQTVSVTARCYDDADYIDPLEGVSEEVLELVGQSSPLDEFCPGALPSGFTLEAAEWHQVASTGADVVARRRMFRRELERSEA